MVKRTQKMTAKEQFENQMTDPGFAEWYHSRPSIIQDMVRQWPFDFYRISQNAPYSLTCPGSIVELLSYNENGDVRVGLRACDKLAATIEHEKFLCAIHGTDPNDAHGRDISAYIDPIYLEQID